MQRWAGPLSKAIGRMADLHNDAPGDDVLTAYLDGELTPEERSALEARFAADPQLRARLDAIAASTRPYKQAFALVLDAAPRERLGKMVNELAPQALPAAPRRMWMAAAALVLFAAGIGIGVAGRPAGTSVTAPTPAPTVATAPAAAPSWRQVVAEYLVLTTADTLAVLPNDNPRLADAMKTFAGRLQLDVTADKLMMPMAALKDVRLFDYRGRPLVEAAYLTDDAMAVAFCIILNGQPDAPPAFEQREGQNIVFWTAGGHGFMVAGKAPREKLEATAKELAARFS